MTILSSPAGALLLAAALLLTLLGRLAKKNHVLSLLGGFLWAAGSLAALVDGAPLRELVAPALLLLCAAGAFRRKEGPR